MLAVWSRLGLPAVWTLVEAAHVQAVRERVVSSPGSAGSPLDRIEAVVAGWRDQGTWRAFREDWFPETLEALVNVAKAAEPMANLPYPVSADEREQWLVRQQQLREALAVLSRSEGTDKEPT